MIRNSASVLEFPMVDQDPLPQWTFGRVTLLGDAAHPMLPRGSNGSAQAILDTAALGEELVKHDPVTALQAYEDRRRETTSAIVLRNRSNPPDVIVREVYERTGDKPFANIDDVISHAELKAIADSYRGVVGIDNKLAASRP
jgi:2-polyprenyl-6-methoxyphenol hydroxylase-like FAD-dependent oxidoreductase